MDIDDKIMISHRIKKGIHNEKNIFIFELIDVIMDKVNTDGELYEGLSRLRQNMSMDIVGYTTKTFIDNNALRLVAEGVSELG